MKTLFAELARIIAALSIVAFVGVLCIAFGG